MSGLRLRWNVFLLRFAWRHKQLGCAQHIGTSCMGEAMWICKMHDRAAL